MKVNRCRWWLYVFVVAIGSIFWHALPCAMADGEPPRELHFVSEPYPPFEFVSEGKTTGINVDVTARIMARLGIPHTFRVDYPFTRVWLMLRTGKADAAPSISYQPQREPFLHYTPEQKTFLSTGAFPPDYLWKTEYVMFINRRYESSLRFDSYEQLEKANYRVGVLKEYTYNAAFQALKLNRREYISTPEAFAALDKGEIDVVPMDRTVGEWTLREMGLEDRLTSLDRPLFSKPYLMVFSRASRYPDLYGVMTRYYAELRKMRASGEYQEIYESYIKPPVRWAFERPLVFVCEEWSPFECLEDGRPAGIDVDVVEHIMGKLGIPYEIRIYPWSRAWMLVSKGRADAVLSVSYEASRETVLWYTDEQRRFAKTGELPPDYLWLSEYVFFVKKNADRFRFESYEQMKRDGYRIGTNKDYSYNSAFTAVDFNGYEFPSTQRGLEALVAGEIDLYPMDRTVGLAELDKMGLTESVTFLPKPLFSKPYLAPFSRLSDLADLPDVMAAFNAELRKMRDDGTYDAILQRYRRRPPAAE